MSKKHYIFKTFYLKEKNHLSSERKRKRRVRNSSLYPLFSEFKKGVVGGGGRERVKGVVITYILNFCRKDV